jgi:hypothetical protein
MSVERCFGGFAGSKSAPAAMGGERSFADPWVVPSGAISQLRRGVWGRGLGKMRLVGAHQPVL